MEELRSEDLEELVQELEEESGAQEPLPQEVEDLVRVLQTGSHYLAREAAAELLGNVGSSSARIVRALIEANESDPHPDVRKAATGSLRAPVHQQYLQGRPDLMEATQRALQERPSADRQRPRPNTSGPTALETQLKSISPYHDLFGLALAARAILALKRALQQGSRKGETGRGRIDSQSRNPIRCLIASSVAGLVVGVLMALWQFQRYLASRASPGCGTPLLVSLIVGAVVGAVVAAVAGGEVQERQHRIVDIVLGAILAAVVASLSGFVIFLWRIVEIGGP